MTHTIAAALVTATIAISGPAAASAQGLPVPARQPVAALQAPALARAAAGVALTRVEPSRRDPVKNGAIIGAIIGGAAGAVGGWALAQLFENEGRPGVGPFLYITGLGAGTGAAIGAGVDALIR